MQIRAMMSSLKARLQGPPEEAAPDAQSVQAAELAVILGRPSPVDPATEPSWGLALSGGGIRSATFCLGVLQALARNELLGCFHYLSTVSGGGYIGGFLQGLIHRHGYRKAFEVLGAPPERNPGEAADGAEARHDPPTPGPGHPIRHLREYSNYLNPRKSPFSGDTLGMVGTYARNVLLIQLQLCALLLAITLLPLVLHAALIGLAHAEPVLMPSLSGLIGMLAVALLAYVTTYDHKRLPTLAALIPTRVAFAAMLTIWLLAIAAFVSAVGLAHYDRLPIPFEKAFSGLSLDSTGKLGLATAVLYILMWMAWLLFDRWQSSLRPAGTPTSAMQRHWPRFLLATIGTGIFAAFTVMCVQTLLVKTLLRHDDSEWLVLIFGPVLTMSGVVLTGILHLGLAGPALSDLQREIWARVGGKTAALVLLGMTLPLALTVYGPWLLMRPFTHGAMALDDIGWTGLLTWLSTTAIGVMGGRGKSAIGDPGGSLLGRVFGVVVRIAPWVFILGLIVALSLSGQVLLSQLEDREVVVALRNADAIAPKLKWLAQYPSEHPWFLAGVIGGATGTWLLLAMAVDVNEFSLNAFYRNRLVRCYLGASNTSRNPEPTTNFDIADDLPLDALARETMQNGSRPLFPLICSTMNLVAAKQLDWQDRKAASFCMTPGFCGHLPPTSRADAAVVGDTHADIARTARTPRDGEALASSLTLGSAIAISGAAFNPNMGYHSSPAVTFLLTLFDARLGWWLPNPSHASRPHGNKTPFFGRWLLAELFGRTHGGGRDVHLSDGGHFENLGLYELVRRRCRFILCVDAGADPERDFADLGNAVQKCRVDFDVEIRIDTGALQLRDDGHAVRSCAVGDIVYPDGSRGTLLYLKPTLTGEESTDIQHYARTHPHFPHQTTLDQFFDEAQFESYRRLGMDVASRAIGPVSERVRAAVERPDRDVSGELQCPLKEKLLVALREQWAESPPGGTARFAQHSIVLSQLFARLRETPELAVLDAQFYPAWTDLVTSDTDTQGGDAARPIDRWTRLPAPEHFRACFYFCQELSRLMEAVYHDLDFERAWDHPDHRGWMNAFRQWSGAPIFRIAWAMGAPTFGSRFVAFCERRLGLPRLDNEDRDLHALHVVEVSPDPDETWERHCDQLADAGRINHIEHAILRSTPMLHDTTARPTRLFLLRLRWRSVLPRTANRIPDTTLGIAALSDKTLRVLRVQDHVRRMGLGREFMRLLIARTVIHAVDVRSGDYGLAGLCHDQVAAEVIRTLEALRDDALRHGQERDDARPLVRAAQVKRDDGRPATAPAGDGFPQA